MAPSRMNLETDSAFCVWDIRLKEVIPNSDEKDIRVSPSRPLRVVTNITPFAPRTPYTAVAEASFNTEIVSISSGSICAIGRSTPSISTKGLESFNEARPRINIVA